MLLLYVVNYIKLSIYGSNIPDTPSLHLAKSHLVFVTKHETAASVVSAPTLSPASVLCVIALGSRGSLE